MTRDDHHWDDPACNPREPDFTPTRSLNRRVVLKASAGLVALAAAGIAVVTPGVERARGQEVGGTRAREWTPDQQAGAFAAASIGAWVTFEADYDFFALGASWEGGVGTWPIIELQLSADGASWSDTISLSAQTDDGGQPTRDGRLFTGLAFSDQVSFVRYRTVDSAGAPGEVAGIRFVYIDPSDGPWDDDISASGEFTTASTDPLAPPEVVTRAEWGADESWRFDTFGEIWPPEYQTVTHIIIHHTQTANRPLDVAGAIRSIYYYHAVSRGWGDIGYYYLVDFLGNVYEGRVGGEGAVAGHAAGYNEGTAGIGTIGRFDFATATPEARAGLVAITAWAGRNLDPLGVAPFNDIASLPTICAHRDVNPSGCPGDGLYDQLPAIRDDVANALAGTAPATPNPAFAPGDAVTSAVPDGTLREGPGLTFPVITQLALGEPLVVADGPATNDGLVWYQLQGATLAGWAAADLLTGAVGGPTAGTPEPDAVPFEAASGTRFVAGDAASVVDGALNLHAAAGLGTPVLVVLPDGTPVAIVGGPVEADGFVWYEIDASPYGVGWCVGDFLRRS